MQPERARSTHLFADRPAPPFGARLLAALGCLIGLGVLTGCPSKRFVPVAAAKPFQGLTVQVACPTETAATLVQRYGQIWASQTGAQVKVAAYDPAADGFVFSNAEIEVCSQRLIHLNQARHIEHIRFHAVPEIKKAAGPLWQ